MEKGSNQVKSMDVLMRFVIQKYDAIKELKGKIRGLLNKDEKEFKDIGEKYEKAIGVVRSLDEFVDGED